jgi:glycosyltransferase involved in cell wall biosynthesis
VKGSGSGTKIIFVVNESYFFVTHRLALARAAKGAGYLVHIAAPVDHVWAPDGFDVSVLEAEGFTLHPLPLSRRGMNPLRELQTIISLWRLYNELRPDLVHHITIKPVLYGGLVARLVDIPAVVNLITGLGQIYSGRSFGMALLRKFANVAYRISNGHHNAFTIVQNSGDLEVLAEAGAINRKRTKLIRGSGVAPDSFPATDELHGTPIVILPARLIWEKGVGEFVAAARQLKSDGVDARFALVGDTQSSNPRAVPEEEIRAWVEEGTIEWWGRRTDMAEVFSGCHVVCLPTTYGEGVPKALIEASSSARSVVASDIAGCREIVRDGKTGLIVPPGDIEALALAMKKLIEDGSLRRQYGSAGRSLVEAEFSEDLVVGETMSVYEDLLANRQ